MKRGREIVLEDLSEDPEEVGKELRLDELSPQEWSEENVLGSASSTLLPENLQKVMRHVEIEHIEALTNSHPYYKTPPGIELGQRLEHYALVRDFRGGVTNKKYRMVENWERLMALPDTLRTKEALSIWFEDYQQRYTHAVGSKERADILQEAYDSHDAIRQQARMRRAWTAAYRYCSMACALFMVMARSLIGRLDLIADLGQEELARIHPVMDQVWEAFEPDAGPKRIFTSHHSGTTASRSTLRVAPLLYNSARVDNTGIGIEYEPDTLVRVHRPPARMQEHPEELERWKKLYGGNIRYTSDEEIDWSKVHFHVAVSPAISSSLRPQQQQKPSWKSTPFQMGAGKFGTITTSNGTPLMAVKLRFTPNRIVGGSTAVFAITQGGNFDSAVGGTFNAVITAIDMDAVLDAYLDATIAVLPQGQLQEPSPQLLRARVFNAFLNVAGNAAQPPDRIVHPFRATLVRRFKQALRSHGLEKRIFDGMPDFAAILDSTSTIITPSHATTSALPLLMQFMLLPHDIFASMIHTWLRNYLSDFLVSHLVDDAGEDDLGLRPLRSDGRHQDVPNDERGRENPADQPRAVRFADENKD
jgi:hypothetical protein